ncbi:MAG: hypothetical protein M1144_04935, partial [Candidatus Thermoplasmatota archaeon]|nr:hypothetical protein [Candidatus Thermoplasmatota archaeon]
MTEEQENRKQYLIAGAIFLVASLAILWFVLNLYFDRWGIGGFAPSPYLPYPLMAHSPSENAGYWSWLIDLYLLVGIPIVVVIMGEGFLIMWKYRDRPDLPDPEDKIHEDRVPTSNRGRSSRSLLYVNIFVAILLFSLTAYSLPLNNMLLGTPSDPAGTPTLTVMVEAYQWGWTFQYPNHYNSTDSAVLPLNTQIIFKVYSIDVMHDFAIPALKVKVDAYPGHTNTAWTV